MGFDFDWEETPPEVTEAWDKYIGTDTCRPEWRDYALAWSETRRLSRCHTSYTYGGFGEIMDAMRETGMLFHVPEDRRTPWPDADLPKVEIDGKWYVTEASPEYAANQAAQEVCLLERFEHPGIPEHKFGGSDGYRVWPDEIRSALDRYHRHVREKGHPTHVNGNAWSHWIGWIECAAEHGGFRVN